MARFVLDINSADAELPISGMARTSALRLVRLFRRFAGGHGNTGGSTIQVRNNGTVSTATVTLATALARTVVVVNDVSFVAVSGAAVVANREFSIDTSNVLAATSLAAAINGYAPFSGVLTAAATGGSSGDVVITSSVAGASRLRVKVGGIRSYATATCASVIATNTIIINGVTLTGIKQRATGTLTAGGTPAAGNTFSIQGRTFTGAAGAVVLGAATFSIDSTTTAVATSIAAQINAYEPLAGLVTATSSSAVVTVRAVDAGTAGNSIPLTGTAVTLVASATTLLGGIAVVNNQFDADATAYATDTQTATDLARCINASITAGIANYVEARSNAAVVTMRSKVDGAAALTLTSTGGTITVTGSGFFTAGTIASVAGAQAASTITVGSAGTLVAIINGVSSSVSFTTGTTETAVLLATAINSQAALKGVVSAAPSAGTVVVTASVGGLVGNLIPLTVTGTDQTATGSGFLAGGALPTTVVVSAVTTEVAGAGTSDVGFTLTY